MSCSARKALFVIFAVAPLALLAQQATAPRRISFSKEVQPIFAARCVSCHGPKGASEGLDLSSFASARRGSAGGSVIIPGEPERSKLFTAVLPQSGKASMPPGRPLTEEQVEIVREWIRQGAADDEGKPQPWPDVPPMSHTVPKVKRPQWVRNPIDAFVLDRLEREALSPSGEADKAALLRRVTFALTGASPSPSQVARFVADRRPDAYERLVQDLLLQSKVDQTTSDRWSAAKDDPLKGRVEVNRAWAWFFGRGLVEPVEEFGSRGKPSHPELLDWLTLEARRLGWDRISLSRLIVTSATYRQTSQASKALLGRDPKNELHGRGPGY